MAAAAEAFKETGSGGLETTLPWRQSPNANTHGGPLGLCGFSTFAPCPCFQFAQPVGKAECPRLLRETEVLAAMESREHPSSGIVLCRFLFSEGQTRKTSQVASPLPFPSSRGGPERARPGPQVAQPGNGSRARTHERKERENDVNCAPTTCQTHAQGFSQVLATCKALGTKLQEGACTLRCGPTLQCTFGLVLSYL